MPGTAKLTKEPTRIYKGNFEITRYLLRYVILLSVKDTNPEKNPLDKKPLWSSECYILQNGDYADVIDPGFTNLDEVDSLLDLLDIKECDIFLTHGHFDHLYSAAKMLRQGNIHINKKDAGYITGISLAPQQNRELAHRLAVVKWEPRLKYDFVKTGEELEIFHTKTIALNNKEGSTPNMQIPLSYWNDAGHTKGHTTYIFEGIAFAGDAVVCGESRWYIDFMFGKGEGVHKRTRQQTRDDCRKTLNTLVNNMHVEYVALAHGGIIPMDRFRQIAQGVMK
jgi:glyoxylase-like metal-dependent hydrolase (beta-lactamase superfamily II)